MNHEESYQEIEASVLILGAVYAAFLVGSIFWLLI
jgi:hypothetical protein